MLGVAGRLVFTTIQSFLRQPIQVEVICFQFLDVGDFDQTEREETVSANRVAVISCNRPTKFFKR